MESRGHGPQPTVGFSIHPVTCPHPGRSLTTSHTPESPGTDIFRWVLGTDKDRLRLALGLEVTARLLFGLGSRIRVKVQG